MTVFNTGPNAATMDFNPGDVGYVKRGLGHYLENVGDTDLVVVEVFRSERFADISLSDWLAHTPRDGWSAYCGTKAALAMFTRSIAKEYGDKGVFAYSLQPGMVDTEMQVSIRRAGINEISRIPREQLDPPERSANVIAWLASERPAELAGQDLHVSHPAFAEHLDRPDGSPA